MITSTSNPQVKQLIQLQKKSKERTAQDVFVVEGIKMYQEVPKDRLIEKCSPVCRRRGYHDFSRQSIRERIGYEDAAGSAVSGASVSLCA
mgnify:CR=1 FL=1